MTRFHPFTRTDLPYRTLNNIPLKATVLTPLHLTTSTPAQGKKHPLIVRWHGGGFIVGHRMYEPWFAQWLLDLALDHEAILISPDYRLLPESNGAEILDDVAYFWRWAEKELPRQFAQRGLPGVDIGNILCCGESSGGFISVYCALSLTSMLQRQQQQDDDNDDEVLPSKTSTSDAKLRISAVISISAPLDATCLLYTSPSPRDGLLSRMPSSA